MAALRKLWLAVGLHIDAARRKPLAYVSGVWWFVAGKRLRSRFQLAPLLGSSPYAYKLWILRDEPRIAPTISKTRLYVLVISNPKDHKAITKTLSSLQTEKSNITIIQSADDLNELARTLSWNERHWFMPIYAGDIVKPGAVEIYYQKTKETDFDIVYADDDLISHDGNRHSPHFKPNWNKELFNSFDYLSGSCILNVSKGQLLNASEVDDWMKVLINEAASGGRVAHVPHILHHRMFRPSPKIPTSLISRFDTAATVTIIIPTRNRADLLENCLNSLRMTEYPFYEVVIVDNDSDDPRTLSFLRSLHGKNIRVIRYPGEFNFSAINNYAVKNSKSDVLCFLNNDIEVSNSNWLTLMTAQAERDGVGAVGAQLLYPDGRIQHAGVVLGIGGAAAHAHRALRPCDFGYFRRHLLPQYISAVTAACMVVRRDRFTYVSGFNEQDFKVAFNDVDLCMRLNQQGWRSFYEPRAVLTHHESVSRGLDRDPIGAIRLAKEVEALQRYWDTDSKTDFFHHPQLSKFSEHFVVKV